MKKSIIFLFFIGLCAAVFAQNESDFVINTDTGVITGYYGDGGNVFIPDRVRGVPVTGIADFAFQNKNITGISLPINTKIIGAHAFDNNQLTAIGISDNVEMVTSAFPFDFVISYLGEPSQAGGIYTLSDGTWVWSENNARYAQPEPAVLPQDPMFMTGSYDTVGDGISPINITIYNYLGRRDGIQEEVKEEVQDTSANVQPQFTLTPPGDIHIIPGLPDPNNRRMYRLQVGAFYNQDIASWVFNRLKEAGFEPAYEFSNNMFRVLAVGIPSANVYHSTQRLGAIGFREIWVRE